MGEAESEGVDDAASGWLRTGVHDGEGNVSVGWREREDQGSDGLYAGGFSAALVTEAASRARLS